jgi:hypothetical protein
MDNSQSLFQCGTAQIGDGGITVSVQVQTSKFECEVWIWYQL